MKTDTILKGCATLKKLQRNIKDDYNFTEFIRGYDTTTRHEITDALQKVLSEREKTVKNEIKAVVNE